MEKICQNTKVQVIVVYNNQSPYTSGSQSIDRDPQWGREKLLEWS